MIENWAEDWLKKQRKKGRKRIEIKMSGKRHYVYDSTTRWDKKEKKIKKVSIYKGRLTREGFIEGKARIEARSIYEYWNSLLVHKFMQPILMPLKNAFPDHYMEIAAMAAVKVIDPQPIKLISSRWEKLYLSRVMNPSLSPSALSRALKETGSDVMGQNAFFSNLISDDKSLLFDLSYVFSRSVNLQLAEKGYNKAHAYLPQVNIVMLFSVDKKLPVTIKVIPGSVRDIKSFRKTIEEMELKGVTVVVDRGMASINLVPELNDAGVSYVLPLKRNFKIIDYSMKLGNLFVYRERGIKWNKKRVKGMFLYLFEDVKLRSEEENTFISLVVEGKKKREDMKNKSMKFGRIAIVSDLDLDGEEIYQMFKQRENIECAFDSLKNTLESDKTYLGNDDAVRGYFFVSFVALYIYYAIMNMLREKKLLKNVSVRELLLKLSKVYVVTDGKRSVVSEIPKKVEDLKNKIGKDIFPKI